MRRAELIADGCDPQVVATERVAPLRDAVRLVDRNRAEELARVQRLQDLNHLGLGEAFWSEVEERDARLVLLRQVGDDSLAPLGVYRGGVLHGDNAAFVEVVELVHRECEKRRDADGDAVSSSRGRSLEAERFAVARRETHEGVTARENGSIASR